MTRALDSSQIAAITAPGVAGIAFIELDFAVTLRLCTLPYTFSWNGNSWLGVGALGDISPVQENAELQAQGLNLTLSGIDPTMISTAMNEQYQGKQAQVWYCPVDPVQCTLIGSPVRIFNGRIDTMAIEVGDTAAITLSVESKLIDFFRSRVSRYNDADQQAKFPGDLGMQYAAQVVNQTITWGRA